MSFPREAVEGLRQALVHLEVRPDVRTLRASSLPSLLDGSDHDGSAVSAPLSNIQLVGNFPTSAWRDDPTMPDFCAMHKYRLGHYCVADLTLTDGANQKHDLTMIVNMGDGDCNTGYWGGVFRRLGSGDGDDTYQTVARVWSTGDTETTIRQEGASDGNDDNDLEVVSWFKPYPDTSLSFPQFQSNDYDDEEEQLPPYFSGLSPGNCESQLEKLLGVGVHTVMSSKVWRHLPIQLRKTKE